MFNFVLCCYFQTGSIKFFNIIQFEATDAGESRNETPLKTLPKETRDKDTQDKSANSAAILIPTRTALSTQDTVKETQTSGLVRLT